MGSGPGKHIWFLHPQLCSCPEQHLLGAKSRASFKSYRRPGPCSDGEEGVQGTYCLNKKKSIQKMLQNHLTACEHNLSGTHKAEVCPSQNTCVMLHRGALNYIWRWESGFGENRWEDITGRNGNERKTSPGPSSRMSQTVCAGDGCERILMTWAWKEADRATECKSEELQAQ